MTAPSALFSGTNVFASGELGAVLVNTDINASIDGGGVAITVGKKFYGFTATAMKIVGWIAFCDVSATLTVDVWACLLASAPPTVANTITGTDLITITAGTQASDFTLSGWGTKLIPAGSALIFNVASNNNATLLRAQLIVQTGQ